MYIVNSAMFARYEKALKVFLIAYVVLFAGAYWVLIFVRFIDHLLNRTPIIPVPRFIAALFGESFLVQWSVLLLATVIVAVASFFVLKALFDLVTYPLSRNAKFKALHDRMMVITEILMKSGQLQYMYVEMKQAIVSVKVEGNSETAGYEVRIIHRRNPPFVSAVYKDEIWHISDVSLAASGQKFNKDQVERAIHFLFLAESSIQRGTYESLKRRFAESM